MNGLGRQRQPAQSAGSMLRRA